MYSQFTPLLYFSSNVIDLNRVLHTCNKSIRLVGTFRIPTMFFCGAARSFCKQILATYCFFRYILGRRAHTCTSMLRDKNQRCRQQTHRFDNDSRSAKNVDIRLYSTTPSTDKQRHYDYIHCLCRLITVAKRRSFVQVARFNNATFALSRFSIDTIISI